MADFCNQCAQEHLGQAEGDLTGLVGPSGRCYTLCEGCGNCAVNDKGDCVSHTREQHEAIWREGAGEVKAAFSFGDEGLMIEFRKRLEKGGM